MSLVSCVLEHTDLISLVLARLDPKETSALSQTCRDAHAVLRSTLDTSPKLLVAIARNSTRDMLKLHVMGWFGLTSAEADGLPRLTRPRKGGGFCYLYSRAAYERVPVLYTESGFNYTTRISHRNASRIDNRRTKSPRYDPVPSYGRKFAPRGPYTGTLTVGSTWSACGCVTSGCTAAKRPRSRITKDIQRLRPERGVRSVAGDPERVGAWVGGTGRKRELGPCQEGTSPELSVAIARNSTRECVCVHSFSFLSLLLFFSFFVVLSL